MSLEGKVAMVTGSRSEINLSVAAGFAAYDCNVMLNGFGDQSP